jgi:hypothetical protein
MAINIIERAVTPYNSSASRVSNKERYSLYAPAANVNKPGMAGYDPKYFAVREQIVELSVAFLASILHHRPATDVTPDGIKESNTVYSNFTHEVLDYRTPVGGEVKINVTGNLFVLRDSETVITEILFAVGRVWSRKLNVNGLSVTSIGQFEPAYDKHVTHDELAVGAVKTENIYDANVTRQKIATKAVDTTKLEDSSVTTVKIVSKAVTTEKLNDKAVTTDKIADEAVTTDKIADEAITREKLGLNAVTTEKILNENVTTPKINNQAVTEEKLAPASVTESKIGKSAVTREKVYTGAIDETKLSTALSNRLLHLEQEAFTNITYDQANGILTFTTTDGKELSVDLPLELIVSGGRYDEKSQNLVLTLSAGDEIQIPLDDMTREFVEYVDGIRESIYVLQKAPPLAALASAVLLTTPTLAMVAGIT